MKKPYRIKLKYKNESDGSTTMMVDSINGAVYKWQFCKSGTAIWTDFIISEKNSFTTNLSSRDGDKYRCLILTNNQVIAYSKTLTVGRNEFKSENEYRKERGNYRTPQPSVADTDGMDGKVFERYCAEILKKNGYKNVQVTQVSGDYGIDILAQKDSVTYAIQCKCYSGMVGNKAVQEAFSGKTFYNCMVAAVLTNSYFTEAAIETAKRSAVILWDRDYLDNLIKASNSADGQQQKRESYNEHRNNYYETNSTSQEEHDFFKGCTTWDQVKDRYRKLMQMYHPDYAYGDVEYAKIINAQYERLQKKYGV